jgi:hypothetical protein
VLDRGCQLSMDGRSAWRDNVFIEGLWRSVKYECVYLKTYDGERRTLRHRPLYGLVQYSQGAFATQWRHAPTGLSGLGGKTGGGRIARNPWCAPS